MKKRVFSAILAIMMLFSLLPANLAAATMAEVTEETDPVLVSVEKGDFGTISLRYDDYLDLSGKTVEIVDAGTPTSYRVGYGVEENAVADEAVVRMEGDTLVASGVGTAQIRIDSVLTEVTVEAAPISVLLLIGQSNMQGSEGDENQSIVCPDGMVYATYGDRYTMTVENATDFVPSALTGDGSLLNVNGNADHYADWPVYLLNEKGVGKKGPDSGFAYEWVRQTGEKVWVINAAHGGSSITTWQKTGDNYKECVLLFRACMETMEKEIAAGHYTLSHLGYFWCQGCSDYSQSAAWYVDKYLAMHENLKTDLAFRGRSFEFGGIIPVRAGHESYISYRQGVYTDTTTRAYHESFKDLRFTGPRVAQYWMTNNPDLPDIWNVCNIGEDWVWMPDGTNGVSAYFRAHYPNGTVDYTTQVQQEASWYTPTTPKAVHDSIHYNQIGYNEVGREAARNALILLGEIEPPETETTVQFLAWDGYTAVDGIGAAAAGNSGTLVVPKVYPVWRSKEVTYQLTDGLRYTYYDLLSDSPLTGGTLTAVGADGAVSVTARELTSYRWDLEDGLLVSTGESENRATRLAGSTENGVFIDTRYQLEKPFLLLNDENWVLEWKMTGPWYDDDSATSKKIFCEDGASATSGAMYLLVSGRSNFIGIGYFGPSTHIAYGVNLSEHGISVADTHIYRLANHIKADGSNEIILFVDGQQIGAMTRYFTGSSGDMGTESNYLSGKSFTFGYMGTPKYLLDNGVIEYVCVVESGADPNIHFHDWSDWETVIEPGPDGPGLERRTCPCGEVEERTVTSVWQTTKLAQYIQNLPDPCCGGLNLWSVLRHDPVYYVNSKGDWAYHSSGNVPSVTIPVQPGDQIFATSFGKAGENGHSSSNGIRVTWFDINGVCRTTDPAGTYAEFSQNGGYLIAPDGAIAVNIPLWNSSDDNEIKVLNRNHIYENGVCTICGERQTPALEGRTVSILGASVCTYKNVSNGTAADTTNSTIRNGALYYPSSKIPEVGLDDTWWMQLIDDLGLRLLVNNSWSGSALLHTRRGTVGAYVDRCVQLHDDTGDNAGEEPDIILIQMGTNDFQYYKDTLGTEADIDYDALIIPNGDGTYQYAEPTTTAEAQAITLHKISVRYPNAEVYYLNATHRVDGTDDLAADYYANQAAVSAHFGVPVASIYDSEIRAENFDRYIGDGRVHPNNYGMDVYTETVKATILANTAYAHPDAHTVHYALENVAADYGTDKLVLDGAPFSAVLTPEGGYDALSVKVLMGGEDITAACYADGTVTIGSVTADVTVAATAVRTPKTYRWESDGAELVPVTADGLTENALTRLNGTTADGVFSSTQYALERAVMLQHDLPWELEWTCAGDWRGIVFSSRQKQQTTGMTYLSRTRGGMLCFGTWTGQQYDNYGVDLSGLDDQTHTFRLKNRIADDGGNMVWLYVDGAEIGPMNNYYVGSSSQNATSDWLSGRDFSFSYIGVEGHELNNCRLEYLEVKESGAGEWDAWSGKVVSILGDSISTFAGYIPVADGFNLEHLARYPQDNLLTDVNETWWMQFIDTIGAKLGINDSWRGAMVTGAKPVTTGTTGENAAFANLTRIRNLGSNGDPDLIVFYGGTNDYAHLDSLGAFDPAALPETVDLTAGSWENMAEAYAQTLLRLQSYYPEARILCILPGCTKTYYSAERLNEGNDILAAVCEHYGVPYVDLRDSGLTADDLPDGIHPGAEGMDKITAALLGVLAQQPALTPGENVVWPVTHTLENAKASLGYYHGISDGKPFQETLSGEDLQVTVTMGGEDITEQVYRDGMIDIAAVTGALTISAADTLSLDGHLSALPGQVCAGLNLWPILEHDPEYYAADGWSVHAGGKVYSVTIPVQEGERLFASSVQASQTNGGSIDGIRVTYFGHSGVLHSMPASETYAEFAENGYLTVPEGACYANIPMWTNSDQWEIYLLDRAHEYAAVVTAPTYAAQGYTTHTCTICGDTYVDSYTDALGYDWMLSDGEFKVLFIGNSFSTNAGTEQLLNILQAYLGENVSITVGICSSAGKTMTWHATQAERGEKSYSMSVITTGGKHQSLGAVSSAEALSWADWDAVSLQPYDAESVSGMGKARYPEGEDEKYYPLAVSSAYMLDYVSTYAPNAAVYYFMPWVRTSVISHDSGIEEHNAMAAFTPTVLTYLGTESGQRFTDIAPVGTAIQTAKTTYLGLLDYNRGETVNAANDPQVGLLSDGWHVSYQIGRYITALTFAETMIPASLRVEDYVLPGIAPSQSIGELPAEYTTLAQLAVGHAVENWKQNGSLSVVPIEGYETDPAVQAQALLDGTSIDLAACTKETLPDRLKDALDLHLTEARENWPELVPEVTEFSANENGAYTAVVQLRFGYTTVTAQVEGNYTLTGHNLVTDAAVAPTCTETGLTEGSHCTRCDYRIAQETVLALGHDLVTDVAVAPTCTETGLTEGTHCTRCDYKVAQEIVPALGHDLVTDAAVAPTCTETGLTEGKHCTRCDYNVAQEVVDALGHDLVTDAAVAPTCTETGLTEGTHCTRCDYKVAQEVVPALGHDLVTDAAVAPTCTETGLTAGEHCTRCNYKVAQTVVPALGHDIVTDAAVAPTCTEPGLTAGEHCSRCDYKIAQTSVPALGHDIVTDAAVAPTCTATGLTAGEHCTRCDYKVAQEVVSALGHDLVTDAAVAPTCTEPGLTEGTHCTRCDYKVAQEVVSALGHDLVTDAAVAPTCTETGLTEGSHCTRCDYKVAQETIAALGHDLVTDVAVAPTCTETGLTEGTHCTRCDYKVAQEVVDALGHDLVTDAAVVPTCTETGLTEGSHCTRCDYKVAQETVPALGHDLVTDAAVAPTCTETGLTEGSHCTRCNYEIAQEVVDALGHDLVTDAAVAPTCTETGLTEGSHCTRCDYEIAQETVSALGHAWDDGKVTTQPTATKDGVKTFTCTRCGATRTEMIPATGETKPCDGGPSCPSYKFTDVKAGDWYHEAVDFAVKNGLFNGMSETTFEPNTPMTRGMLVTVLWRYEGQPEGGVNQFADVKDGVWYAKAVAWAAAKGIVNGVAQGKFDPNGRITREQMAAILYRYSEYKTYDTGKRGDLTKFPDASKVSAYANDAIAWAVGEGLIGGNVINGKTLLDPQGNATRAQVATILMRFIQNVA